MLAYMFINVLTDIYHTSYCSFVPDFICAFKLSLLTNIHFITVCSTGYNHVISSSFLISLIYRNTEDDCVQFSQSLANARNLSDCWIYHHSPTTTFSNNDPIVFPKQTFHLYLSLLLKTKDV